MTRLYTVGHSNQPIDEFLIALAAHDIAVVVDVRRFPSSRRHPHFSQAPLRASLEAHDIDYIHLPELGGHREPRVDSHNTAWREPAFRGYADYTETPEFARAISRVLEEAARRLLALMCAERHWTECHRGLIADHLKASGHEVIHILSAREHEDHPYTRAARLVDGGVSYRGLL
jgi:uncharacterized protein (DUF488 family)